MSRIKRVALVAVATVVASLAFVASAFAIIPDAQTGCLTSTNNGVTLSFNSNDLATAGTYGWSASGENPTFAWAWQGVPGGGNTYQAAPGQYVVVTVTVSTLDCGVLGQATASGYAPTANCTNNCGGGPGGGGGSGGAAPAVTLSICSPNPQPAGNTASICYSATNSPTSCGVVVTPGGYQGGIPTATTATTTYSIGPVSVPSTASVWCKNGIGTGTSPSVAININAPPPPQTCVGTICGTDLLNSVGTDDLESDSAVSTQYDFYTATYEQCRTANISMTYKGVFGQVFWEWDVAIPFCTIAGPTTSLVAKVVSVSKPVNTVGKKQYPWSQDNGSFTYNIYNVGKYTAQITASASFTGCVPLKVTVCSTKQPHFAVSVDAEPRSYITAWGNP